MAYRGIPLPALDARYLQISNNLSDIENTTTARVNLGVAIGSDVQAWDAQLDDIAALAVTDGNFIVGDGTNWVAESGATARASLGLVAGGAGDIWVEKAGDTMTGDLLVDTDSAYDLGSSTNFWANAYVDKVFFNIAASIDGSAFDGLLITTGSIIPSVDDTDLLGSTISAFKTIFVREMDDRDGIGGITFKANPIPNNTVRDIGSSSADPWNRIFVNDVVGPTVFNEVGADVDFRFETNALTHALFIDGGTNDVLIDDRSVLRYAMIMS